MKLSVIGGGQQAKYIKQRAKSQCFTVLADQNEGNAAHLPDAIIHIMGGDIQLPDTPHVAKRAVYFISGNRALEHAASLQSTLRHKAPLSSDDYTIVCHPIEQEQYSARQVAQYMKRVAQYLLNQMLSCKNTNSVVVLQP